MSMHYAKYSKSSANAVLEHSDRGIDKPDIHKHSNEQIDSSKTYLNYDLKNREGLTAYEYYKNRIDDINRKTKERTGKAIRKDAVTLCSWVVTAPKNLSEDMLEDFFKGSYNWFSERYSEENIVTAAIHMDETTPHMHFQFVPIIKKDGVEKLCAKDMETPYTLKQVHPQLQQYLKQQLGYDIELINGATENGNKSILQLKNEELQAENEKLKAKNKNLDTKYKSVCIELKNVLNKKAKASEIKSSLLFGGEKVTYHKSMLESTRKIGDDAYEDLMKAKKLQEENIIKEQELAQKEKSIVPLYNEASTLADKYKRLCKEQEFYINKKAREKAEKKIDEMLQGGSTSKERRMMNYLKSISFSDGETALEKFEAQERLLRQKSKGFDR